ncbi:uncharacterized protein MONOS_7942 [Monocercomonoides exilis]|uniref:uncharacterized protein n=1 Tax=Monocercomonoides exilis TaxID=2049356 RepID=UPI00355A3323|nr:hypothetical protein MONOS_7942 [Monocercomonoides exilis]|eukprot:MONOS_7942.1-p1 / transcript=MONOS_7942.1 / gene=MONOS_7942 / organism=Monocercomonoides_exilis_PA203 / gene_product=unspecified product / transcript_product=unspecified product / location=Mono_scaffold00286:36433-44556(-) / protein_length=2600 / sequence_SO=supercontig / SO=protein_coding / is_pseudo=false
MRYDASSDETCQIEELKKEEIADNLESTWMNVFQKGIFANGNTFETDVERKEDEMRHSEKIERTKNGDGKVGNDEKLKFGESSPYEVDCGTNMTDELKIWKRQRFGDESWIEGSFMIANSSIKLHSLGLMPNDCNSILNAMSGCFVEVSRCGIEIRGEKPPFCLNGGCGLFTNISLRFPLDSHLQKCPSLFSSKPFKGDHSENCHVSICSSHFSSFCVSSAPFLASPLVPFASLSELSFCNISTSPLTCSSLNELLCESFCVMSSCTFMSVCDACDGGIVPSINNPLTSLTASNTSFIGCCRTRNVEHIGNKENKLSPGRQNTTDNGKNTFLWCEWNGSKATGTVESYDDGASNGGAICMHDQENGELSVSHCVFNGCTAYWCGGGIHCHKIKSVEIVNSSFNGCIAQNYLGGGAIVQFISSNVQISRCEFLNGKAEYDGGGLCLSDILDNETKSFKVQKNEESKVEYDNRICYSYGTSDWEFQHFEKKGWLKDGMKNRFVDVNGDDSNELCITSESTTCKTIGFAVKKSDQQLNSTVTVFEGKHQSEEETINVGEKRISLIGKGREESVIEINSLSEASTTLFSVTSGQLEVLHMGIDYNTKRSSSPNVFVVSDGSGSLMLEDVLISSSVSEEEHVISSSLFVMPLSQLSMDNIEIRDMKISEALFSEPSSAGSASRESILANVKIQNVHRAIGDGAVVAKSVKAGETFVVWNTTMANCECLNGNGGGIKIELEEATSKVLIGTSSSCNGGTTTFSQCSCSGLGGGVMLCLVDDSCKFEITSVNFESCAATLRGKSLFVEAQDLSAVVNSTSIGFNPEIGINIAKFDELCGRERNKEELIVPLVVFLRTFSSPAYVSGREQGSEFRLCGYEDYPCRGIGNVGEVQFPSSKRVIRLASTFSFDEEVQFVEQSYEIDSSEKNSGIIVGGTGTKTQEALVMNNVSSTITGILFELGGSIGDRSSFVHSTRGILKFADCGIKMGSEVDSVNYVFVSASEGKVEIIRMRCGGSVREVRFVKSVIVVNGSCECMMDEVIINKTTSNGVNGLIEIATSSSATIQNCSITNCDMPSCGVIKVENCSSITLKNTSFENITRVKGDGGCVCVDSNEDRSKCTIRIENSSFISCEVSENGKGGGGLLVSLKNPSELHVSSARFEKCCASSTSGSEGKGGGIFLSLVDADAKFELIDTLVFDGNDAEYGKNMFIMGKDFNSSVTNESFNFDYSSMINDKTLFVGSDSYHSNKDLFMFLVPYSSFEIFVSFEGFDVVRCGSEEEPCFSMWKGMKNMKEGDGKKTIQIEESTIIRDSFNLSNYQIKKDSSMGEEETKAILNFEKAIGSQLEYFMGNDIHLELTNIHLQLTSGFDNSAKTIISNRAGDLIIYGCSFHSEAGANIGFDCVFLDVIGGSVEVNDLSMESCNVGNSIFVIRDYGVSCHFLNVRVESLNESGGCILSIKGTEPGLKINEGGEEMNLKIDNSSFSGVKRSDNGPSIFESKSEKKIDLDVKESNITEDKAETSEKGGAIFFTLGASGSMQVIDSTISHCSCSYSSGRGGGVYLATKERGDLNFTFVGMKFSSNTARVGNDIFIECYNITSQINESQFRFDLREGRYTRMNAIYGRDECDYQSDTDLIGFVTIHQSDTIIVSSVNGSDERQCGTNILPCNSINHGMTHLTSELISQILVIEGSLIEEEMNLEEMSLCSKSREMCKVEVKSSIKKTKDGLVTTTGAVSLLRVNFVFDSNFISSHESLISPEGGILEIVNCSFTTKQSAEEGNEALANIPFHIINIEKGEQQLMECSISNLILQKSTLYLSSQLPSVIDSLTISNSTISKSLLDINECGQLTIKDFKTENISVEGNEESLISCLSMKKTIQLTNFTMGGVRSKTTKGKLMKFENCLDMKMDCCIFDGSSYEKNVKCLNAKEEEMCRWDGSVVDVVKSSVLMKETTISNSPEGGITMNGGSVEIEKGEFTNNNPSIEGYPSARMNILCSDSGVLNVMSLKGGDGVLPSTSLWILNEGCKLSGIVTERLSSFFIPVLESVETKEEMGAELLLKFKGKLLLPCNISFKIVKQVGDEDVVERYEFNNEGCVSENEVDGKVPIETINNAGEETEVSVSVLFGKKESPSSTDSFILKNRSETQGKGDDRIVEGGKEGKSYWLLIVIALVVLLLIILIIAVAFIVRWKKVKNEAEDLREIVNDNIRKDPKAFEMVTMEMSPEEQWRRAEREAEKKNDERIKKRVYERNMEHSESSEHLLSESGSTEYILGRDSDKIPEWALEKVDEKEEETRKRTPSPSISSTSTASTTDSDSTFVRAESLCPTTSSMSNLVDAMACSSPHEKLIVDLRDSLFMLLHGRNEKKEMAIGSLKEREQTAAQILFWVANGALHSFDEEKELPSLANLSPHIVLFSEHMVICIALHSDCSSSDDSDSSSISSMSMVSSSSSNVSVMSERFTDSPPPSSAFEDCEDNRKECLRWKAPELQMNKKMGATKESVAFSIGMMVWECLTLDIPFGEYEAEVAGDKISKGERPSLEREMGTSFTEMVHHAFSPQPFNRPSLVEMKRIFIQKFPAGGVIITASDAIDVEDESGDEGSDIVGSENISATNEV